MPDAGGKPGPRDMAVGLKAVYIAIDLTGVKVLPGHVEKGPPYPVENKSYPRYSVGKFLVIHDTPSEKPRYSVGKPRYSVGKVCSNYL